MFPSQATGRKTGWFRTNLHNRWRHTFIGDQRYRVQSNEASDIPLDLEWESNHRVFHQSTLYRKVVTCPPVNTVSYSNQLSSSQHSTIWWSNVHQSTQYPKVVKCPPVNTVPRGQMSTSQHNTPRWSNVHQSTQYPKVAKCPPVNTVPHGGQMSSSQHSIIWWSNVHQLTQYHMVVECLPVNTVPYGGQMESLWGPWGSLSRFAVYVFDIGHMTCLWHKPTELAHSFCVLFLCLFLSLRPFQLYFIP